MPDGVPGERKGEQPEGKKLEQRPAAQLVAEIRLLVHHVSSAANTSLRDLKVENPYAQTNGQAPGAAQTMSTAETLQCLDTIDQKLTGKAALDSTDATFLQLARDGLSRLVRPASNLSVAYTTLVTNGGPAKAELAAIAYPNLVWLAKWHRRSSWVFLFLAIVVTYLAVDLSVRVATGKYALQTIDVLNGRRDSLVSAEEHAEASLNKTLGASDTTRELFYTDGSVDDRIVRICDRSKIYAAIIIDRVNGKDQIKPAQLLAISQLLQSKDSPIILHSNPEVRRICGQDDILKSDFILAHQNVADWINCESSKVVGIFLLIDSVFAKASKWLQSTNDNSMTVCSNDLTTQPKNVTWNVELRAISYILSMGNYILPVMFALLGSILFVVLEYSSGIRKCVLLPSDFWLSWIRLVLGVVAGAVIGLLFTAYGPITPPAQSSTAGGGGLISSLTLSASGLAFLAGFGADGVFAMLQQLVARVFATNQNGPAAPSPR